jgi:hypothetical protein
VFEALGTYKLLSSMLEDDAGMPQLHVVLPDALARDADIFEARLRSLLYPSSMTGASASVATRLAKLMTRSARRGAPPPLPETLMAWEHKAVFVLRCMLQALVRGGCREAAGRLARAELAPLAPSVKQYGRKSSPAARWSALGALQPVARGELLVLLLPIDEADAAWDAALAKILAAAEQGGAAGMFVHACGVGAGAAAAATEQRLEDASVQAANRYAMSVATDAFTAAYNAASSTDGDGSALSAAVTRAEELSSSVRTPTGDAVLQLLRTAAAVEQGECDLATAWASRKATLAPVDASDAGVVWALQRLDAARNAARRAIIAARRRATAADALRAAAAEAAAAEADAVPLAARLDAVAAWEAALAGADDADDAAADALSASLAHVRDAEDLSARLAAAAAEPPAAPLRAGALAALRVELGAAAAAPPAVTGALAAELHAAQRRVALWAALLELAEPATMADAPRLQAAMAAAMAAGADARDMATSMTQATAAIAAAAAAAAPPPPLSPMPAEPGEWVAVGERIWFDKSAVLGSGSRGTVVYAGFFTPERAGRAALPSAVKRLRRDAAGAGGGADVLTLVTREVDLLRALSGASTRIVTLRGFHVEEEWVYMVFERCARSLAQQLTQDGPLPPAPARIATLAGVIDALADVHAARYVHNDLHAGNVLLAENGDVKLTDFQLAVPLGRPRSGGGAFSGPGGGGELANAFSMSTIRDLGVTLNMTRRAPEVLSPRPGEQLTSAVDVWALGCLAFQLLSGKPTPYTAKRAKHGAGGGGGGGAAARPTSSEAAENKAIMYGQAELAPLDAAGLPPRAAREARHLIAATLAVNPRAPHGGCRARAPALLERRCRCGRAGGARLPQAAGGGA